MYFEKGVDANISCLRFGAGDHGISGFIIIFSLNGLILEDWKKKSLLYILSKFMKYYSLFCITNIGTGNRGSNTITFPVRPVCYKWW